MNQSKIKYLKRLFADIAPFPAGDPRNRMAFEVFKQAYLKQPAAKRFDYLYSLTQEIELLKLDRKEKALHAAAHTT